MKHSRWAFVFMFLVFCLVNLPAEDVKLLKIKEDETAKGKSYLLVHLGHLDSLLKNVNIEELTGEVNLFDPQTSMQIRLAKISKGRLKWDHKTVDNDWLRVKFSNDDFPVFLNKITTNPKEPGIQFQVISGKKAEDQKVSFSTPVTCNEYPELGIKFTYPKEINIGEDLSGSVSAVIGNSGVAVAENVEVHLLFSAGTMNLDQKPQYTDQFSEDGVVKIASRSIAAIDPGKEVSVTFDEILKIPETLETFNFYLGVLLDPDNQNDELNEANNSALGFVAFRLPEVNRFSFEIPNVQMVYVPETYELTIATDGKIMTDGKDWRKCNLKSYIFQIKQLTWDAEMHWEIETQYRTFWEVKGKSFCSSGGQAKEIKNKVSARGGSRDNYPASVTIEMPKTVLEYDAKTGRFAIVHAGAGISYVPYWSLTRVRPFLFQLKQVNWEEGFWEVNTIKKQVFWVTGGTMGETEGGTRSPIDTILVVE